MGFDLLSLFALAAIVVIGLPHGAFDGAVALALGYGKTLKSMLGFVITYVGIAILVVLFWLAFPVLALFFSNQRGTLGSAIANLAGFL